MDENYTKFAYLRGRSIDYSVEQIEACLNRLKQMSNPDSDSIAEQAIDDALNRLSVVLEILRKIKAFDDMVLELENLIESHDS